MSKKNIEAVTRFLKNVSDGDLSPEVLDAARMCLVDWFAVSLAAKTDAAPLIVRSQMNRWATRGEAISLYGDAGAAATVALVNGTLAHSLDFDDLHLGSAYHASGPTIAAALAVGMDRGSSEMDILKAFVAGYEVGTTMGDGVGLQLAGNGWHPTGVMGHFSATAAAALLLDLPADQLANAMGLTATQCAGLQMSGGSMAKPFHVGKAAMNGVMAAEMAMMGMDASTTALDQARTGILGSLLQQDLLPALDGLGKTWQILGNSFKPYAACQLTHATFEVARQLAPGFDPAGLKSIDVIVNPLAPKVASRGQPATSMEGKFSLPWCAALGLGGYTAGQGDFTDARIADASLQQLTAQVNISTDESIPRWGARITLEYGDGNAREATLDMVRGGPDRALQWPDLRTKFLDSTSAAMGAAADELLDVLENFGKPGQLARLRDILIKTAAG